MKVIQWKNVIDKSERRSLILSYRTAKREKELKKNSCPSLVKCFDALGFISLALYFSLAGRFLENNEEEKKKRRRKEYEIPSSAEFPMLCH
jgi:hypothetical protein